MSNKSLYIIKKKFVIVDEINGWQIRDNLHGKKKNITPKFHVHNNQKKNNSMKSLGCYINCLLSDLIITKTKCVKIQKILAH
jgi:hypothetical protein